jgi:imidazolonepropionase-like amidohydrolase
MTLTRRQMLFGTAATMLLHARESTAQQVSFDVPPGACDCHTHMFGDPARFPFWSGRTYTPPATSIAEWQSINSRAA